MILPPPPAGRQIYRKVRDRASYAFALVSLAAILDVAGGKVQNARLAMGGVAHKPWTPREAERELAGASSQSASFEAAGRAAVKDATGHPHNEFKIALAQRLVSRTLGDLAAGSQ